MTEDGLLGTPTSRMWKGAGPQGGATQIRNSKRGLIEAQVMDLLPTPRTSDTNGPGLHGTGGMDLRTAATLLPTPRATDGPKGGPNQRGSSGDMMLPSAVVQLMQTPTAAMAGGVQVLEEQVGGRRRYKDSGALLQTPSVADGMGGHLTRSGARSNEKLLPGQAKEMATDWGPYEPAIRRWELAIGQPAPSPTEPNKNGNPRLSPAFCEWMMGAPEGWITSIPISRNEQLKAAGNGVVPQQAAAALDDMLAAFGEAP